jgi:hypothetical protein
MKSLVGIVGDEFVERKRRRPGKGLVPLLRCRDEDFSVCRESKRVTICRLVYHKSPPFFYFASSLTHGFR